MEYLPDLLTFNDGSKVVSEKCWEKRRKELLKALSEGEYGFTPEAPDQVEGVLLDEKTDFLCGLGSLRKYEISFDAELGRFQFPSLLFTPYAVKKAPLIILLEHALNPFPLVYMAEEFLEKGFSLAVVGCTDIATDDGDFTNGIAPLYTRRDDGTDWGKLGMWAFGLSRALDFYSTLPEIDAGNIAVAGHSRLGKTALWAGAQDERIKFTIANDSGCSGAAYERGNSGKYEDVARISTNFPYWFCENYGKYAGKPFEMPFDQHFAVALCAPRHVLVGGAVADPWADPWTMELSLRAVTPVYALLGKKGYVAPSEDAEEGAVNTEGDVTYHLRAGGHELGRVDWMIYLSYMKGHLE